MTGRAPGGSSWRLDGFKLIQDDHHLEMWADTTTLFMTIAREAGGRGQTISKGIIRILPADFLKQMTTMAVTGTNNPIERLKAPAAFGKFFAGGIFDTCGGVFQRPNDLKPDAGPRERRRSASRCQSCLVNGCLVPLSVQRQVANVHGSRRAHGRRSCRIMASALRAVASRRQPKFMVGALGGKAIGFNASDHC